MSDLAQAIKDFCFTIGLIVSITVIALNILVRIA